MGSETRAAPSSGEPTESDWIVIGDRRDKVFALPRRTPTFTCYFGYGGLTEALLGFIVMLIPAGEGAAPMDLSPRTRAEVTHRFVG